MVLSGIRVPLKSSHKENAVLDFVKGGVPLFLLSQSSPTSLADCNTPGCAHDKRLSFRASETVLFVVQFAA
jgi:hypothetical protein